MFVVNFNETVSLGLPVSMPFSANANELERAIWRARASGETALRDAVMCERIARDIRNQYTIGYLSSAARNGAYRAVRVMARSAGHGKLVVRTRAGYIADSPLLLEKGEGSK